jgi:hypothetical protein
MIKVEINFADEEVVKEIEKRSRKGHVKDYLEKLKNYPNRWAIMPRKYASISITYQLKKAYPEFEFVANGGTYNAKYAPEHKDWTMYVRYVGTKQPDSDSPTFR